MTLIDGSAAAFQATTGGGPCRHVVLRAGERVTSQVRVVLQARQRMRVVLVGRVAPLPVSAIAGLEHAAPDDGVHHFNIARQEVRVKRRARARHDARRRRRRDDRAAAGAERAALTDPACEGDGGGLEVAPRARRVRRAADRRRRERGGARLARHEADGRARAARAARLRALEPAPLDHGVPPSLDLSGDASDGARRERVYGVPATVRLNVFWDNKVRGARPSKHGGPRGAQRFFVKALGLDTGARARRRSRSRRRTGARPSRTR